MNGFDASESAYRNGYELGLKVKKEKFAKQFIKGFLEALRPEDTPSVPDEYCIERSTLLELIDKGFPTDIIRKCDLLNKINTITLSDVENVIKCTSQPHDFCNSGEREDNRNGKFNR